MRDENLGIPNQFMPIPYKQVIACGVDMNGGK